MVDKLVELTLIVYLTSDNDELFMPAISMESNSPEEKKKLEDEDRKSRNAAYDEVLKSNKKLSPKQKAFVRANYDQLAKIIDQLVKDSNATYYPSEQWAKESLQIGYSSKFTKEELIELIPKFQGSDGQKFLMNIFSSDFIWSYWEGMENNVPDDEKDEFMKLKETASYKEMVTARVEYQNFASSEIGKNFIVAFNEESQTYVEAKYEEAQLKHPEEGGYAITLPENLNKIFNKFVEDNYK